MMISKINKNYRHNSEMVDKVINSFTRNEEFDVVPSSTICLRLLENTFNHENTVFSLEYFFLYSKF